MKSSRALRLNRIKTDCSYSVAEICQLLSVHKNTVRQWIRNGLLPIDDLKPYLIYGKDLKTFLAKLKAARKQPCAVDEFYCCRCRAARKARGCIVDLGLKTSRVITLKGICEQCECKIFKCLSITTLPEIGRKLEIQKKEQSHLVETLEPSLQCYFNKDDINE